MNKTMEYMAYELPVVAFDLVETRVSAQDAALYATPGRIDEYADLVLALLDDEVRRKQMAVAGRRRVEDVLAWRHQIPPYVGVYDRLFERAEELSMCGIAGTYLWPDGGPLTDRLTDARRAPRPGRVRPLRPPRR